jgi:acyl carrier protein
MPITPEAIIDVISAESGLSVESLRPEATLGELDISSLDLASIAFEIEDRFSVELSPDDLPPELTIAGFVEHVRALRPE